MKFLKCLFRNNERYLVWHEQAEYGVNWVDEGYSESGIFNYMIYYYPYRKIKYELEFNPKHIRFWPADKFHATSHQFYKVATNKLRQFQQGGKVEAILAE